jgi:hypothetical protein
MHVTPHVGHVASRTCGLIIYVAHVLPVNVDVIPHGP